MMNFMEFILEKERERENKICSIIISDCNIKMQIIIIIINDVMEERKKEEKKMNFAFPLSIRFEMEMENGKTNKQD